MSEEKKTTTTENKEEGTMKKKSGKGVAIGLGLALLGAFHFSVATADSDKVAKISDSTFFIV